jgi:AcrR family transcriptional regulator
MSEEYGMRRLPRQSRSQARVSAILDAAAQLFAEIGYDAATTNAIAERANTRIGSLYHFFPNKEAILNALVERYLAELRALNETVFDPDIVKTMPLPALIDRVVDEFARYSTRKIGFEHIFYGSQAPDHLRFVSEQMHQEIVAQVESVIALRSPHVDAAQRSVTANLVVAAVKAAMPFTAQEVGLAPEQVLTNLKLMLTAYLQSVLENGKSALS